MPQKLLVRFATVSTAIVCSQYSRTQEGAGSVTQPRFFSWLTALVATVLFAPVFVLAAVPAGYPRSYANRVLEANQEGRLSIYSTTDAREVDELLRDFRALYPQITVDYADINSTEVYSRFIAEVAAKEGTADLLWSSAMDLQIKLVNDGYAQAYASPEKPNLPPWASWKNEAYGITSSLFITNVWCRRPMCLARARTSNVCW
jgi:iron(III) transport system substrate-binding protein